MGISGNCSCTSKIKTHLRHKSESINFIDSPSNSITSWKWSKFGDSFEQKRFSCDTESIKPSDGLVCIERTHVKTSIIGKCHDSWKHLKSHDMATGMERITISSVVYTNNASVFYFHDGNKSEYSEPWTVVAFGYSFLNNILRKFFIYCVKYII